MMITALNMALSMETKNGELTTLKALKKPVELVMSVTTLIQITNVKGYRLIVVQLIMMETVQTVIRVVDLQEENVYSNDIFIEVNVAQPMLQH